MSIGARGSDRCGLESFKDQVSTDIHDVVKASKSDLMARGVAIVLLQTAKRVGPQYEATELKDLSGKEGEGEREEERGAPPPFPCPIQTPRGGLPWLPSSLSNRDHGAH